MQKCIVGLLLLLAAPAAAQEKSAKVRAERARVDAAIEKGVGYLRHAPEVKSNELLLLTLLHAGVRENDPDVQRLLKAMLDAKPSTVYIASLQAMALEELDRVKYQGRIAQCAQFLVDNQCRNGQWGYDTYSGSWDVPNIERVKSKEVASGGSTKPAAGERKKPKVVARVMIKQIRSGAETGDSSNSAYAALGLRACHESGVLVQTEVLERAHKSWVESLHEDEDKGPFETRGWGYYGPKFQESYGAMTAGGLSSVCILDSLLGQPWTKDPIVDQARNWLALHFSATEHPKAARGWNGYEPGSMLYYWLYALERAAMITGTETFGAHAWYADGAKYILETQKPDGSWLTPSKVIETGAAADTCFAILFLRRATAPLNTVASEDRFLKKSDPK